MYNAWLCDHHTHVHSSLTKENIKQITYTEGFMSCGHCIRGWFPMSLWSEKFLSTCILFSWLVFRGCPSICINVFKWNAHTAHILVLYTTSSWTLDQWHKFQACMHFHTQYSQVSTKACCDKRVEFQNLPLSKGYCKLYEFPSIKLNSDVIISG